MCMGMKEKERKREREMRISVLPGTEILMSDKPLNLEASLDKEVTKHHMTSSVGNIQNIHPSVTD